MVAQIDIKALTYITTQCSRQAVLSLICSLLNTVSYSGEIVSLHKRMLTHHRLSSITLHRGVFPST